MAERLSAEDQWLEDGEDAEYRIEYQIQRRLRGEDDFTEVGFGSSGGWGSVNQAVHMASSAIETRDWETEPGQPDPSEVDPNG